MLSDKEVFVQMLKEVEAGTRPAQDILDWMNDEFIVLYRP